MRRHIQELFTAVDGSEVELSVIDLAGRQHRQVLEVPVKPDKIYYIIDNALCHTDPLESAGRRGQYCFVGVKQLQKK